MHVQFRNVYDFFAYYTYYLFYYFELSRTNVLLLRTFSCTQIMQEKTGKNIIKVIFFFRSCTITLTQQTFQVCKVAKLHLCVTSFLVP